MSAIHLQSTVIASMFVCGPVELRLKAPRVSSYSASSFIGSTFGLAARSWFAKAAL